MMTSPTGNEVIVMGGGIDYRVESKSMFMLTGSMEWNLLEQTLQHEHFLSLKIPIPDEMVYLQNEKALLKRLVLHHLI